MEYFSKWKNANQYLKLYVTIKNQMIIENHKQFECENEFLQYWNCDNEYSYTLDEMSHNRVGIANYENNESYGIFISYDIFHCSHRVGGPAFTHITNDGRRSEHWDYYGKHHRIDGPAYIKYNDDFITEEVWYIDGKFRDGLYRTEYYVDGTIYKEYYSVNNKCVKKIKYYQ